MKKCNTEIMKDIKTLEEMKTDLLNYENSNYSHTYSKDEEPIINGYDYSEVKGKIKTINEKVRYLKGLLAHSNVTTIVDGFDMTIGESLIYLAQLNGEKERIKKLASRKPLVRGAGRPFDSSTEYTELEYDPEVAKTDLIQVTDTIYKLQLAIDRTNLTNMIDVRD